MKGVAALDGAAPAEIAEVLEVWWNDVFEFTSEGQYEFEVGSSRPWQLWVANRGAGKTFSLPRKALRLALANGSRYREDGSVEWVNGLLLGRTQDETQNKIVPYLDEHIRRFKERTGIPLVGSYSGKDACYLLNVGVKLYLRSYGQPRTLAKVRGWSVAFLGGDEVAHAEVDEAELLKVATFCVRGEDLPERQAFFTTSPNGDRGIVAHFARRHAQGDPHYALFHTHVLQCSHISEEMLAEMRAAATAESWAQEAEAAVLRPSHTVYPQYSDDDNVIIDYRPPAGVLWGMCADWGENNAWFGVVAFHPDGRWVVFYEEKHQGTSRILFRQAFALAEQRWSRDLRCPPCIMGADRAVKSENQWLRGAYSHRLEHGVKTCDKRDDQLRAVGIAYVQYMLAPLEGPRRLFVSDSLAHGTTGDAMGIRDALPAYVYKKARINGELMTTDKPEENTPPTHPCDGLRYLVVRSRSIPDLHGGQALPESIAEAIERGAAAPHAPFDAED